MPEAMLLRMKQITHVGFVTDGANQEDGDGSFIEIWKRAPTEGDRHMSTKFDRKSLSEDAQKAFAELEEAQKVAKEAQEAAETKVTEAAAAQKTAEEALEEATKDTKKEDDPVSKLSPEAQEVVKGLQAKALEQIEKAQEEATKAMKAAEAAGKVANEEQEKRVRREIEDVVKTDLSGLNTDGLADRLYDTMQSLDDKAYEAHVETLKAASKQVEAGNLFKEAGADLSGQSGDAWAEVVSKATKMVEAKQAPTQEQAVTKVLEDDPELYGRYKAEQADA